MAFAMVNSVADLIRLVLVNEYICPFLSRNFWVGELLKKKLRWK